MTEIDRRKFLQLFGTAGAAITLAEITPNFAQTLAQTGYEEGLDQAVAKVISLVREVSRSQVDLWSQIPALALYAQPDPESIDTRTIRGQERAFGLPYINAYRFGFWKLPGYPYDSFRDCPVVDVNNGELISVEYEDKKIAPDNVIFKLALKIELLDAGKIVQSLREKATENIKDLRPQLLSERNAILQDLGLSQPNFDI